MISADKVYKLHDLTGVSLERAKEMLILSGGDFKLASSCIFESSFSDTTSFKFDLCRALIIDARLGKLEEMTQYSA